jgi:hypothetical protein
MWLLHELHCNGYAVFFQAVEGFLSKLPILLTLPYTKCAIYP